MAETKSFRGLLVSVCRLRLNRSVRLLDLPRPIGINPFEEESLPHWCEFADLLWSFAQDLGRPLQRSDDLKDYIPCQVLAAAIGAARIDAIRYPSAMQPSGTNVVFFDPSVAEILESRLVRVVQVSVQYEAYSG